MLQYIKELIQTLARSQQYIVSGATVTAGQKDDVFEEGSFRRSLINSSTAGGSTCFAARS